MQEEWKPLENYKGLFVSNLGRVLSVVGVTPKILKPSKTDYGHEQIRHKRKNVYVHRLVFMGFKGDLKNGLVINHINGIPFDNRPENLEQVTQKENVLKGKMPNAEPYIHFLKDRNAFQVYIRKNNKVLFRAYCKTKNDAIETRNEFLNNLKK